MTDTALTFPVDIWLRAEENAATRSITGLTREPRDWVDDDVKAMLEGMLLEMHRLKYPEQEERPIALRSLSWIVNPYEEGGVVVAIEITLGAGDRVNAWKVNAQWNAELGRFAAIRTADARTHVDAVRSVSRYGEVADTFDAPWVHRDRKSTRLNSSH